MTSVGWIGLGRLGAPCAAALAYHGHHVVHGYDVRGVDPGAYDWASLPPVELADSIAKVVAKTDDVVYVAVQTPHTHEYGGEVPTRDVPRDFEYGYLVQAVRDVCTAARDQDKSITLAVVSTVLPGTFDRHLRALVPAGVTPVYHPFLIAMGTVVEDFIDPEMTIFGVDRPGDETSVRALYETLHAAPAPVMTIASAELAKVAYNTFISSKIVFANALLELADVTGAHVDEVTNCLALGADRIVSARYLRAGMGDGGACHPRDNHALSALAQRHGLSVDYFDFIMRARDEQTRRWAEVIEHWHRLTRLPVIILGKAYKPNVELVDGSPALLLTSYLRGLDVVFRQLDRRVFPPDEDVLTRSLQSPHVYFIATNHDEYRELPYAAGSVVIDPFGDAVTPADVVLIRPGRRSW